MSGVSGSTYDPIKVSLHLKATNIIHTFEWDSFIDSLC